MKNKRQRSKFEQLRVYRLAEQVSDAVWTMVEGWAPFAQRTVGEQLVRAADSIGANIAEGVGRGSYIDNRRHVRIARGSMNETQHFLRRAFNRKLMTQDQTDRLRPMIEELAPTLNAYLRSITRLCRDPARGNTTANGMVPNNEQRTTNNEP